MCMRMCMCMCMCMHVRMCMCMCMSFTTRSSPYARYADCAATRLRAWPRAARVFVATMHARDRLTLAAALTNRTAGAVKVSQQVSE